MNRFLQILHEALNDPSDRIVLNADESQWRVLMPPRRSIAITGQDSVKININGDKKAGFTILGTISSEGDRFPLVMLAKGFTTSCHKQLGNHPGFDYNVLHTPNGWVTEKVFIEYLQWIRSIVVQKKIYLVVDQFGAHFGPGSETNANSLNITLIPVPKGATAKYQPLDRGIFGIMKMKGTEKWTKINHQNPDMKWDKATAARIALESWEGITKQHILNAWELDKDVELSDNQMSDSDSDFIPEIRNEK